MKTLSRRSLLSSLPAVLVGSSLLAGCATTRVGTSTSFTINVAKVDAYITAGINAANTTLTLLSTIPVLSQYVVPMKATLGLLDVAADAFHSAVGHELTVKYDNATVKTSVDSVFDVLRQVAAILTQIIASLVKAGLNLSNETFSRIQLTYDALETIISVFAAVIVTYTAHNTRPVSTQMAMAEQRSLRILNA